MKDGKIAHDSTPREVFSKADELIKMSLDIPEASKMVKSLNEKGKDVPGDIITIDQLYDFLLEKLDK